jgi:hypothetical protein
MRPATFLSQGLLRGTASFAPTGQNLGPAQAEQRNDEP